MMKKILILGFLLIGLFAQSQAKSNYQRHGKLTQTEIDAIDVTDTTLIYTAFNTTTGREEINIGAGWIARNTGGGGGGTSYSAGNGLSLVGTVFNIDNPFTTANETLLNSALQPSDITAFMLAGQDNLYTGTNFTRIGFDNTSSTFTSGFSGLGYANGFAQITAENSAVIVQKDKIRINLEIYTPHNDTQREFLFDNAYDSPNDVPTKADIDAAIVSGGTDDQNASEVPMATAIDGDLNVQEVLEAFDTRIDAEEAEVGGGGSATASNTTYTDTFSLGFTDVQTAIDTAFVNIVRNSIRESEVGLDSITSLSNIERLMYQGFFVTQIQGGTPNSYVSDNAANNDGGDQAALNGWGGSNSNQTTSIASTGTYTYNGSPTIQVTANANTNFESSNSQVISGFEAGNYKMRFVGAGRYTGQPMRVRLKIDGVNGNSASWSQGAALWEEHEIDFVIVDTSTTVQIQFSPYAGQSTNAESGNIDNIRFYQQPEIEGGKVVVGHIGNSGEIIMNSSSGTESSTADGSETKITAGANVAVAGTGTTADPYLVSATGGGASQHKNVILVTTGRTITSTDLLNGNGSITLDSTVTIGNVDFLLPDIGADGDKIEFRVHPNSAAKIRVDAFGGFDKQNVNGDGSFGYVKRQGVWVHEGNAEDADFTPVVTATYSDPNSANLNETVGVGNWVSDSVSDITVSSSTEQVHSGTASIKAANTPGITSLASIGSPLTGVSNGDDFTVTGQVYLEAGNWTVRVAAAFGATTTVSQFITTQGSWVPFTLANVIADGDNPTLEFRNSNTVATHAGFIDSVEVTIN